MTHRLRRGRSAGRVSFALSGLASAAAVLLCLETHAAPPQVIFLPAGSAAYSVSDDGNVVVGV